jgi:hypothetical protein
MAGASVDATMSKARRHIVYRFWGRELGRKVTVKVKEESDVTGIKSVITGSRTDSIPAFGRL